jgi:hypothetical protein
MKDLKKTKMRRGKVAEKTLKGEKVFMPSKVVEILRTRYRF